MKAICLLQSVIIVTLAVLLLTKHPSLPLNIVHKTSIIDEPSAHDTRAKSSVAPDNAALPNTYMPAPKADASKDGNNESFSRTEKLEIRYKTLMEVMINYSDFFKQLNLDRKQTESLVEVIVDQKLRAFEAPFQISGRDSAQPTVEELTAFGAKNNKLIHDLIGEDGLDALTAWDIKLERKSDVERTLNEIAKQNLVLSPAAKSSLSTALMCSKNSGIEGDAYIENKPLTPERAASIRNALDREYQTIRIEVQQHRATSADLEALDKWHEQKVAEALQNIARAYRSNRTQ